MALAVLLAGYVSSYFWVCWFTINSPGYDVSWTGKWVHAPLVAYRQSSLPGAVEFAAASAWFEFHGDRPYDELRERAREFRRAR